MTQSITILGATGSIGRSTLDVVSRYPERRDLPWADVACDDAVVGARVRSVARLAQGEKCVVVASAHALMRRVPPVGSGYWAGSTFSASARSSLTACSRWQMASR